MQKLETDTEITKILDVLFQAAETTALRHQLKEAGQEFIIVDTEGGIEYAHEQNPRTHNESTRRKENG